MPGVRVLSGSGESTAAGVDPLFAAITFIGDTVQCDIGATDTTGIGGSGVGALTGEEED